MDIAEVEPLSSVTFLSAEDTVFSLSCFSSSVAGVGDLFFVASCISSSDKEALVPSAWKGDKLSALDFLSVSADFASSSVSFMSLASAAEVAKLSLDAATSVVSGYKMSYMEEAIVSETDGALLLVAATLGLATCLAWVVAIDGELLIAATLGLTACFAWVVAFVDEILLAVVAATLGLATFFARVLAFDDELLLAVVAATLEVTACLAWMFAIDGELLVAATFGVIACFARVLAFDDKLLLVAPLKVLLLLAP